jgi:predicted RNA-binding Zn ribbon-like protein
MTHRHEQSENRESSGSDFDEQFGGLAEQLDGLAQHFDGFAEEFDHFAERFDAFPELFGDRLCLDFVNTLESPRSSNPIDHLGTANNLALWGKHVELLDDTGLVQTVTAVAKEPDAASSSFVRALALREALRRIFRAVAGDEVPQEHDLSTLQSEYLVALATSRLSNIGGQYQWSRQPNGLENVIGAVAVSAVDVLTDDELERVKECPGADGCGHLFFDTSRNGRRRWCSMLTCGSRVKMRQWYSRQRDQERRTPRPPHPPRPAREPRKVRTPARTHPLDRSQEP